MELVARGHSLTTTNDSIFFIGEDRNYIRYYENRLNIISKEEYLISKFGENYNKIQRYFNSDLETCSGDISSGKHVAVCFYQESIVRTFDNNGEITWEDSSGNLSIDAIYDVVFYDGYIWTVYPTQDLIIQYSLVEKRIVREYTIGDMLSYPESMSKYYNEIYVSNMGNNELLLIGHDNSISKVQSFTEPIWEFVKTNNMSLIKLSSGIYKIS